MFMKVDTKNSRYEIATIGTGEVRMYKVDEKSLSVEDTVFTCVHSWSLDAGRLRVVGRKGDEYGTLLTSTVRSMWCDTEA